MQSRLEQGHGIARPLMAAKYFTPMVINKVAVGEEAGNLDEMLKEISNHYDSEVEYATRRLTTAMGPILIALMSALVGFFALAVYMPMWDLAKLASTANENELHASPALCPRPADFRGADGAGGAA